MGLTILLTIIASFKIGSAVRLALATKLFCVAFIWALVGYCAYLLVRAHQKLDKIDRDPEGE
jgi:NADH:ubiquinone oxidoreductase subunit 5 (subunit L)/multisubunit Na+/H+ antiporter MnhA subunit